MQRSATKIEKKIGGQNSGTNYMASYFLKLLVACFKFICETVHFFLKSGILAELPAFKKSENKSIIMEFRGL